MALGDPFGVSAGLGRKRTQDIQSGFDVLGKGAIQLGQQQQSLNMLRQLGIIREEEEPLTTKDYQAHAKKLGGEIRLDPTQDESTQLSNAERLAQAIGLPPITRKTKTIFDAGLAAKQGVEWNPSTGEMILKPKEKEKSLLEQITEAQVAKEAGYEYRGGKIQTKGATGGYGAAQLVYAEKNAGILADAVEAGDYGALAGLSKTAMGPVIVELRKRGVNVDDALLGYKAEQSAMGSARIQEQKVQSAISAQTLLDSSYDPKTGNYMVPPSQHTELAIATARMLSPTGVVAQEIIDELRQRTAREGLAGAAIFMGFDPKEVGGSTQSVINMFAKLIEREGVASQNMLENLKKGKTTDYKAMLKESKAMKQGKDITSTMGTSKSPIPVVGETFNGEIVKKITRIK